MEVPDASKKYLEEFIAFAGKHLSYEPVIIGGWAVYGFMKKQKSIDVDVLLKSRDDIGLLRQFFAERNFSYSEDQKGNATFELETEKHEYKGIILESIIFDMITISESNSLSSDKNINVPWSLCFEFNEKVRLNGIEIRVPCKELLLILKTKALLDREYDKFKLKSFTGRQWLKRKDFKIEKDRQDIKDLLESKIDQKKLEHILGKTNFSEKFYDAINAISK